MRYCIFFTIFCLAIACKKEEVPTYNGGEGISFYLDQYEADSLTYSFAFSLTEKQKDTVFLKMRVLGSAADHDRAISVKAAEGTTARAGVDYELPAATLPAGALRVLYPIVLLNSPEMTTTTFRLVVEVAPSKDLLPGATGTEIGNTTSIERFKILVSNQLLEPSYWEANAFGEFSAVKFRFMIQVTGLTDFSFEAIGVDGYYNLPVQLRNALAEYEAVNGPLMDESGNRVTF